MHSHMHGGSVGGGMAAGGMAGDVGMHTGGGYMTGAAGVPAGVPAGYMTGAAGVPVGGGGSGACGSGSCCGEQAGTGAMAYVGVGGGDWVTETTYKYVGGGRGDLSIVVPSKRNYMPCLALLALLVLGVVAIFCLMSTPVPSSTVKLATTPAPQMGECTFWGDPHLITFDGARPSFYGDGEYWIVKNDAVKIQGRFMGTKYTFGLAATQKVAVGGRFIQDHIIVVEPMEEAFGGSILVDNVPVLTQYGTYSVGGAILTYDGNGELPDKAASQWAKNIVHMQLPNGITLTVYRWGNYLDLRIQMKPLPGGQDGTCGNFNGMASDDTTQAIFERIGIRVGQGDMLFKDRAPIKFTEEMAEMLHTDCVADQLSTSREYCQKELPASASTIQVNSCLYDFCFGMNEHALRTAKTFATQAEREALGVE